jgi:hypothetical protein
VCSQNLTGRLIIRRGREVGDGTGGGGKTVEDGQESGVNAQEEELKEEEAQEVVINGELLRILQDQDVEMFENAVSKSCIFEGVTSYDQLFNPPSVQRYSDSIQEGGGQGAGGGDLVRSDDPRGAAEVIESEEQANQRRFVVRFEGKVVSRHASSLAAQQAQVCVCVRESV